MQSPNVMLPNVGRTRTAEDTGHDRMKASEGIGGLGREDRETGHKYCKSDATWVVQLAITLTHCTQDVVINMQHFRGTRDIRQLTTTQLVYG